MFYKLIFYTSEKMCFCLCLLFLSYREDEAAIRSALVVVRGGNRDKHQLSFPPADKTGSVEIVDMPSGSASISSPMAEKVHQVFTAQILRRIILTYRCCRACFDEITAGVNLELMT